MNKIEIIKQNFQFLVDEFHFINTQDKHSPSNLYAVIEYQTEYTQVIIALDRGQVLINIGKSSWPKKEFFDFTYVVNYFNPSIEEVYIFPEELKGEDSIEFQAKRLSEIMHDNCQQILSGDFSMADQIKEMETKYVKGLLDHLNQLTKNYNKKK